MKTNTVHKIGMSFRNPIWKLSSPPDWLGLGLVKGTALGQAKLMIMAPPYTRARMFTTIPQRPSRNGAAVFGQPRARARRMMMLPRK